MNSSTLLYRQIHPVHFENGILSSAPFRPTADDQGCLSVYNGDQITPSESFEHYRSLKNPKGEFLKAEWVYGLSVQEIEHKELTAHESPLPHSPNHAHIDFTGHSENKRGKIARKLRDLALARGILHP